LRDQPFRRFHADTRAGFYETRIVLAVKPASSGVDDDGVARLERKTLLLQGSL
jgi:hypothetical protein